MSTPAAPTLGTSIRIFSTLDGGLVGRCLDFWRARLNLPLAITWSHVDRALRTSPGEISSSGSDLNILVTDAGLDTDDGRGRLAGEWLTELVNRHPGDWVFAAPRRHVAAADSRVSRTVHHGEWVDLEAWARRLQHPTDACCDPASPAAAAVLATAIVEAWLRRRSSGPKVIVTDCDGVLWRGACGELGAAGVEFQAGHLFFQRWLRRQKDAGVLVALCSKNDAGDVQAVFDTRREMVLTSSDVAAAWTDWRSKTLGIRSIAQRLGVSADALVFVDDSPEERAEIETTCPEVTTLHLPERQEEWPEYFGALWALEPGPATADDVRRTTYYADHDRREAMRRTATSLHEFVRELAVRVTLTPLQAAHVARAAQVLLRTHQFNLTGQRLSSAQLTRRRASGSHRDFVVEASDRFGDYGLIGVILGGGEPPVLTVSNFALSCRALIKGIEASALAALAAGVRSDGYELIDIEFAADDRNREALRFVRTLEQRRLGTIDGDRCRCAVADAARIVPSDFIDLRAQHDDTVIEEPAPSASADSTESASPTRLARGFREWVLACEAFRTASAIATAASSCRGPRPSVGTPFVPPRTALERLIAAEFSAALGIAEVGLDDDLFELGGDSLLAVRIIGRLRAALSFDEAVVPEFFECPSIRGASETLIRQGISESNPVSVRSASGTIAGA